MKTPYAHCESENRFLEKNCHSKLANSTARSRFHSLFSNQPTSQLRHDNTHAAEFVPLALCFTWPQKDGTYGRNLENLR